MLGQGVLESPATLPMLHSMDSRECLADFIKGQKAAGCLCSPCNPPWQMSQCQPLMSSPIRDSVRIHLHWLVDLSSVMVAFCAYDLSAPCPLSVCQHFALTLSSGREWSLAWYACVERVTATYALICIFPGIYKMMQGQNPVVMEVVMKADCNCH